jgi:hypothetical protein
MSRASYGAIAARLDQPSTRTRASRSSSTNRAPITAPVPFIHEWLLPLWSCNEISLSDRAVQVRNERRRRDKVITAADRARFPRGQMMTDRSVAQIRIATSEDAHSASLTNRTSRSRIEFSQVMASARPPSPFACSAGGRDPPHWACRMRRDPDDRIAGVRHRPVEGRHPPDRQ